MATFNCGITLWKTLQKVGLLGLFKPGTNVLPGLDSGASGGGVVFGLIRGRRVLCDVLETKKEIFGLLCNYIVKVLEDT